MGSGLAGNGVGWKWVGEQSKKVAQGEQQASDGNQYICITAIGVVWSSA